MIENNELFELPIGKKLKGHIIKADKEIIKQTFHFNRPDLPKIDLIICKAFADFFFDQFNFCA